MKITIFLSFLFVCLLSEQGREEPQIQQGVAFQPLEMNSGSFNIGDKSYYADTYLTPSIVLFTDFGSTSWPTLISVDVQKGATICTLTMDANYGWSLYQWKTADHIVILCETGTEYSSLLDCFVLEVETERFRAVGSFEVSLPYFEDISIDNSYPVNEIGIVSSDSLVTFRFPQRVILRPYDDSALEVDSVIYQLDLQNDSLRLKYPQ